MAKSKKIDRNRPACKTYRAAGRRESNKLWRMIRTAKRQPNNDALRDAIEDFCNAARTR